MGIVCICYCGKTLLSLQQSFALEIIIKIAATTVSEKSIKNIMCTLSWELPLGNDAVDDARGKQRRAIEFISSTLFREGHFPPPSLPNHLLRKHD